MKKKYWKYFLIFIICAMASSALTYSIWHLMKAHQDYEDSRDVYEELEDDFIEHPDTQDESQPDTNDGEYEYLQIDFDGLRKVNPDVIAWIDIPGAGISYPVLKGEDNSYYLTHLASGQFGISGSIFMDYHNRPDFSDQNTIIYGHNMKDDSMFGKLNDYQDRNIYERNPFFYIYVPGKVMKYQIFSCYAGSVSSEAYIYSFPEISDFMDFTEAIISPADYETGVTVGETDRVVTLSTCVSSGRNYRYLVHGKLTEVYELRYLEKI